jgi:hypothetical protein
MTLAIEPMVNAGRRRKNIERWLDSGHARWFIIRSF